MSALELELLAVPVLLRVDGPELLRHLSACYGRSRRTAAEGPPLEARLARADGSWQIAVDGREPRREASTEEALRALNHELLQALMARRREHYYVHAAVLEHGGRALVLPGLSRAGKSTLALALLQAGARYLSDELLCLAADGRALPVPRAPKLRDECVAYFPRLAPACVGHGEARFVPFEALPDDVLAAPAPIGTVVLPRYAPDGSDRPRAITRGAAALALARSSLNFGAHRARSLDWLAELLAEARTFALDWRDPHASAAALLEVHGP